MRLFRYFGREKVKAGGDNNNLDATKKDDDQSNATGVTTEIYSRIRRGARKFEFKKKMSYISREERLEDLG